MKKNTLVKLIAILAMCFLFGAALVACKAENGVNGKDGADGVNGETPYVGENGNWWIGDVDTGLQAEAEDLTDCTEHAWGTLEGENFYVLDEHVYDPITGVASEGMYLYVCTLCGDSKLEKISHEFEAVVTAPTCDDKGYTTYTCACGYSYDDNFVAANEHSFPAFNADNVDTTIWTLADDQTEGCSCVVDPIYSAVCTVDGCNAETLETGKAPGHVWGDWKLAENNSGLSECLWAPVYIRECTVCGDEAGHEDCTDTRTEKAPGHKYESVVTTQPTCTTDGVTTYTCSVCNDSYTENIPAKFGHTPATDAAVAPTCTATGLTEGSHCSVCNTVIVAQEVVPALGHTITANSTVSVVEPTATTEGSATVLCDVCGAPAEVKVLPALNADVSAETNYTVEQTEGECSEINDVYTYTFTVNGVTYEVEFTKDGNYAHSDAPAKEDCQIVLSDDGTIRYYVYKCEVCGEWIVKYYENV